MAGLVTFARKLWPGWSSASVMLVCAACLVEGGMWIAQFAFPQ
ncbi:MAG TPA: hypothetical protein VG166_14600 [Caulobacteraceae bacterium]|jgi:hypothetical protein|nr:hypothetical protein [Caulobacteraceae bacterium]